MWTAMGITVVVRLRDGSGGTNRDSGDAHGDGFTGDAS